MIQLTDYRAATPEMFKDAVREETPSHFDAQGLQFAWDSTSLKTVQKCLRYYKYTMIDNWENSRKSVHLTFGSHYATALEHYHKHRALGLSSDDALLEVVHETLLNTWEIVGSRDGVPIGKPWDSFDNAKTRDNLIRSIVWYVDQFEDEDIKTVILPDGKAAVEYSFTLEIDYGFVLSGHLDRLCDYGGAYYVMDQKTTGATITSAYFDQFMPDTQMSLYTFAGKAILDLPVEGVIIDAAQIAVGFTRFERGFTFRTDSQLEEWYDDTIHDIERARDATLNNHFPMNPASCGNYGGCEFRKVCSRSPEVRENFLKADFVKRKPWNPLEKR